MNPVTLLGLAAAFCTTVSFLPQAIKTIRTRDTSGISLSMYALFTSNIPVTAANLITLIFALIILVYKIRYR